MPRGRWNTPEEAADVGTPPRRSARPAALLLDPVAATITGQVVDATGGFRRFTP